ncbi:MAG: M3 family oligoendopeptidase [Eubacteriaceae bacterium]|nr:M3 family oligoendopeptidase [Eubacteriaceae bacterium]
MEKFSQISYERPDLQKASKELKEKIGDIRNAKDYGELRQTVLDIDKMYTHTSTMFTVAHVRNTIDMNDEFYEKEVEYFNRELPAFSLVGKEAAQAFLASPFRADFEKEFGTQYSLVMDAEERSQSDMIVQEKVRESDLCLEYSKITAQASTEFNGEECNFYGLLKYMQSTDRETRKGAFEAWAALYETIAPRLDEIYTELVQLRVTMAEKLGMKDYIELAYLDKNRFEWGRNEAKAFRDAVKKYYVPLVEKIRAKQAERLGIDKMRYYDEELIFPEGNAVPVGDRDYLVGEALKMYRAMSEESGEFFGFMNDHELFDLETKPGKRVGGYCTMLTEFKAPFIFSNFNGTSADADVLTHEAGHAFQAFMASRVQPLSDYIWSTSEVAEIHSMSMEHFAYPYMEGFFGENAEKYRRAHLAGAVATVPYLVCVDEYQHGVFEDPSMGPMERRRLWHDIEKKYMPWRDYGDNEFMNRGAFWMQKQHIFLYPFYYIDYALAQTCAFQYFLKDREDHEKAWDGYVSLCKQGGSLGYFELLKLSGLKSPFEEETVRYVCDQIEAILKDEDMV